LADKSCFAASHRKIDLEDIGWRQLKRSRRPVRTGAPINEGVRKDIAVNIGDDLDINTTPTIVKDFNAINL